MEDAGRMYRAQIAPLALLAATIFVGDVDARTETKKVPAPRARPAEPPRTQAVATPRPRATAPANPAPAVSVSASSSEVSTVKQAIAHVRKGEGDKAMNLAGTLRDPAARKVVEWAVLRAPGSKATFDQFAGFIRENPAWPSIGLLRRRAEGALWEDKLPLATVRGYFADNLPVSAKGRYALARALLAQGNRAEAQRLVREAWREHDGSADLEAQVLDAFGDLLTRADHKARMDRSLYDEDFDTGMRMAQRLGDTEVAIARARIAMMRGASNADALFDAVPDSAKRDPGLLFNRIRWLRRAEKISEAVQLMLAAPRDPAVLHDLDAWWIERRALARELLDLRDPRTAYRIARDAVPPSRENYRVEHQFTAGWIALRFLNDPATAQTHFERIPHGISNPISLARAGYWQGRAAEAMGHLREARHHYEFAARFPTAYYGQLARTKLAMTELGLRRPPELDATKRAALRNHPLVRALEILYAIDARDLVIPFLADVGDRAVDPAALAMLGEIAVRARDARGALFLGKTALARGLPFDTYAFPTVGIPEFKPIGPAADRSLVYAIARQESHFNQQTVSRANAMGLMQVTPAAGRYVAKKFGVTYDQKRLLSDPVYNTQMGAAEIADLVADYDGSYVLSFAAYNAGRGRVRDWIARFGDPRDPNVDPVDWVERIPFSETRNYVQRVLENLLVYRARLNDGAKLRLEADLRGTRTTN